MNIRSFKAGAILAVTSFILFFQTGCGLLLGNVKPVEEKSDDYRVLNLTEKDPDWIKLPPANSPELAAPAAVPASTDVFDVAYQSKKTSSIISLNSVCRPSLATSKESLQSFTRELLLGISHISHQTERALEVQKVPALQTTVEGKLNGEPIRIQTVVLRENQCLYDLMYVARPESFTEYEATFQRFVDSLHLRK